LAAPIALVGYMQRDLVEQRRWYSEAEFAQALAVAVLRQTLAAAVRWEYMTRNPARLAGTNPQPPPRDVRVFSTEEIEAITAELSPMYRALPAFVAATGLRPEEWQALERRGRRPPGRHADRRAVRLERGGDRTRQNEHEPSEGAAHPSGARGPRRAAARDSTHRCSSPRQAAG
jgi:hypothetical protein